MDRLNKQLTPAPERPVRVLQFGEGNFLRAFADEMIDIANEKTGFNGSVVLVKPRPGALPEVWKEQEGRYTVLLRGLKDSKPFESARVITSVADAVSAHEDYTRYAAYAKCETLRFILSNTTEAGIVLDPEDSFEACPPRSFPGKLTKLLFERAEAFGYAPDKGLIMLPAELIDSNGAALKRCVLELSRRWNLGDRFLSWLEEACVFTSTLVDRIVSGYPRDEADAICAGLGYEDRLLVAAEPFALWVIESPRDLSAELPLPACGLPVVYTDDHKPYKQRKVRILNGAHTSFIPAAYQCGYDYVVDAMNDPLIAGFMDRTLRQEVIPTLTLPREDLLSFAEAVTSRFRNPYIKHALLSICLNSVSKWKARCMPSLLTYAEQNGELPPCLTFSLAALATLYSGGELKDGKLECLRDNQPYLLSDDVAVLQFFANRKDAAPETLIPEFIGREDFFGPDLKSVPGLIPAVTETMKEILARGVRAVMTELCGG